MANEWTGPGSRKAFTCRLNPLEKRALVLLAQKEQRTLGAMMCEAVRYTAKRLGVWQQAVTIPATS